MTKPKSISEPHKFTSLWIHEASRVFHDRLINDQDRHFFKDNVMSILENKFREKRTYEDIFVKNPIIFSNLLNFGQDDPLYELITNPDALTNQLYTQLGLYNSDSKNKTKMNLVFFNDAIQHICRIIRVLLQPRGNSMLIGVSGCGKQSLTRLASYILTYNVF
jgi:dynein heavy chain, axonemal